MNARRRRQVPAPLCLLIVTAAAAVLLPTSVLPPGPLARADQPTEIAPTPGPSDRLSDPAGKAKIYPYVLRYYLEVEGRVNLWSMSRYYRFQSLSLDVEATERDGCFRHHIVGLRSGPGELNYGVGEGPRRHQRYVLLDRPPSEEERARIAARILSEELTRLGRSEGSGPAQAERGEEGDRDEAVAGLELTEEVDTSEQGGRGTFAGKKAYFNYYLWKRPCLGFSFCQTSTGTITGIKNDVVLTPIETPGGKRANPRFFETLEYSLLALPPFAHGMPAEERAPGSAWKISCASLLEGLADLCREVYGKKMTIVQSDGRKGGLEVSYAARTIPGTRILEITGALDHGPPVGIRVSGLKGEIWIESLRRQVLVDPVTERILADDFRIDFGVQRNTKILRVEGRKNTVRILLVDRCLAEKGLGEGGATHRAAEACYPETLHTD